MDLTPRQQAVEQYEKRNALAQEVLRNAKNELYLSMRFLDLALSALHPQPDPAVAFLATDGVRLNFGTEGVLGRYLQTRVTMNRAYLHSVIHCLFAHLDGKHAREESLWNLACDVAAEQIVDTLYYPCIHRALTPFRIRFYKALKEKYRVLNAEHIYRFLEEDGGESWSREMLAAEFLVDDHRYWYDKSRKTPQERRKKWDDIRDKMETELESFGKETGDESRSLLELVRIENREKHDYKEFLRKFCVLKETMQVDVDAFDYIYYDYGMRMYKNMPLIEPLETKEARRIEDFVIVIDTSMSTSGELVRKFLEQTYAVLTEAETFFTKIHVRILQCDDRVQSDREIRCRRDLEEYMERMEIKGQGSTDFRPAFEYVAQLQAKRVFNRLKGLIYFTDGYGTYPVKMPPYETAFVFMKEDYMDIDVPSWAIKLVIEPDEI